MLCSRSFYCHFFISSATPKIFTSVQIFMKIAYFSGKTVPGIWLVQGRTNCAGLTSGEVTARTGSDRLRIPGLAWSDFPGNCLIILSDQAAEATTYAASTEIVAAAAVDQTSTDAAVTATAAAAGDIINAVSDDVTLSPVGDVDALSTTASERTERDFWRYQRSGRAAGGRVLRLVPSARFFTSINLASFTVISAGFSSKSICLLSIL